jgi:hypothetical protein
MPTLVGAAFMVVKNGNKSNMQKVQQNGILYTNIYESLKSRKISVKFLAGM